MTTIVITKVIDIACERWAISFAAGPWVLEVDCKVAQPARNRANSGETNLPRRPMSSFAIARCKGKQPCREPGCR